MPVVSITLDDTNRTILSSAYHKIISDIIETINIPCKTIVVLHKDSEVSLTDNKTTASITSTDNLPSTVANRRIVAAITEDYNEDELTSTSVHQVNAYPIFNDPDVDVSVYPIYVKSDVSIQFTYISPSKLEATRIRDDIRIRLSQTRNITIHEVEYSILIPEIVEEFIADVYDLKSRLVPQSLEDYFREHATKRMFPITDMANIENARLAISEKQIRIIGLFDFSSMPEKIEIDADSNNYKISFTYKLTLDVPRAMVMRYPTLVCNRPLPAKYLQFIEDNKANSMEECRRNIGYTGSLQDLSYFEAHRMLENRVNIKLPVNIPAFDEFNKKEGHKGYGIIASFLTQVDETDCKGLMNLRDIDPYQIDPTIMEHIKLIDRQYIINPYSSFIYLGLHQDGIHFDNNVLDIDADLNVRSKVKLSLYKPVRVTLSVILDLLLLDKKVIERLLENRPVLYIYLYEYLRAIDNFKTEISRYRDAEHTYYRIIIYIIYYYINIGDNTALKKIVEILQTNNIIAHNTATIITNNYPSIATYLDHNDIMKKDTGGNAWYTGVENYGMRTVMSTYIVALRSEGSQLK